MAEKGRPKVVGQNVIRAARIADAYAVADKGVNETVKLSASAKWAEAQEIRSLSKSHTRHRDKECISGERDTAAVELLTRRMERMKELYIAEREQFQVELLSLGLRIADNTLKGAPYC